MIELFKQPNIDWMGKAKYFYALSGILLLAGWASILFGSGIRYGIDFKGGTNVDVRFADLPQIEGATGRFLLQQMAAVAELEAGMISKRTREALAAAKRRGKKLGGDRGVKPSAKTRAKALAAIEKRAASRAADLAPTIATLQAGGATSLRAIAAGLNDLGIETARGDGSWSAVQVARVLDRLAG